MPWRYGCCPRVRTDSSVLFDTRPMSLSQKIRKIHFVVMLYCFLGWDIMSISTLEVGSLEPLNAWIYQWRKWLLAEKIRYLNMGCKHMHCVEVQQVALWTCSNLAWRVRVFTIARRGIFDYSCPLSIFLPQINPPALNKQNFLIPLVSVIKKFKHLSVEKLFIWWIDSDSAHFLHTLRWIILAPIAELSGHSFCPISLCLFEYNLLCLSKDP